MAQKIFALALVLSALAFFTASAEESAPVPTPAPNVLENKPAIAPVSQPVPMPDTDNLGMVQVMPRMPVGYCESGALVFEEGYVKKGNEENDSLDAKKFFIGDAEKPRIMTLIEVSFVEVAGEKKETAKIIAYFDFDGDGIADLVTDVKDARVKENICPPAAKKQDQEQDQETEAK